MSDASREERAQDTTKPAVKAGKKDASAPRAVGATEEVTLEVTSPVHHDGQAYAIGEALSCTAAQATALVAAGAARPARLPLTTDL